jgi:hypothetical protein
LGWASLRIRLNIILRFGRGQGNEENTHDKRATYANSKEVLSKNLLCISSFESWGLLRSNNIIEHEYNRKTMSKLNEFYVAQMF